jgi:carbon monoxide dehydrogenase subunit G
MASVEREMHTRAKPEAVWDAVRDVGALHTRLVPGFVTHTVLEPGARIVTFANGLVVREPIVTVDDQQRRLVWSSEGGTLTHYNAALRVLADGAGSRVVWAVDLLPDERAAAVTTMIEQGLRTMQATLDGLETSS